ncbi:hypothetical protein B0T14DRAFT_121612 [Immersiella caudata]|uniref:Uncharacterized protein n=1 Tax=Immersiella caudata TaxID=314043 RepID=A0AA39X503_9PEZI|nr:hypothetical protein B0T14DRAFT_121612 [Immersiella caudata]
MRYFACHVPDPIQKIPLTDYSDARLGLLRKLQTTCDITVTPIIVSAVELTVYWNDIPDVNRATSTAQLIPLLFTLVLTTMVVVQLGLIIRGLSPNDCHQHQEEDGEENCGRQNTSLNAKKQDLEPDSWVGQDEIYIQHTSRPIFSSAMPITPSSTASPMVPEVDPVTADSVQTSDSSPGEDHGGPVIQDPTYHPRDPPCSYT